MESIISFEAFIKWKYPFFLIDDQSRETVTRIGYYACRQDEEFESNIPSTWIIGTKDGAEKSTYRQDQVYIQKGICLFGNVGTGKTTLMQMLQQYNLYLRSPYKFRARPVWEYKPEFEKLGSPALSDMRQGNWYFDELCLINPMSGFPDKESARFYDSKILVGEEIINKRYDIFKETGWVTHFSTNASMGQLREIYGVRAFSRLLYMCNFIPYIGADRRPNQRPTFRTNINEPVVEATPVIDDAEVKRELREDLLAKFEAYKLNKNVSISWLDFNSLMMCGIEPCTHQYMTDTFLPKHKEARKQIVMAGKAISREEHHRFQYLRKQYTADCIDADEMGMLITKCKEDAVRFYFDKLIAEKKELAI